MCLLVDLLSHLFSSHNLFIKSVIKIIILILFQIKYLIHWQCLPRPYIMQGTLLGRLLHVLHALDINTFSLFSSIAHPISFGDCQIFFKRSKCLSITKNPVLYKNYRIFRTAYNIFYLRLYTGAFKTKRVSITLKYIVKSLIKRITITCR